MDSLPTDGAHNHDKYLNAQVMNTHEPKLYTAQQQTDELIDIGQRLQMKGVFVCRDGQTPTPLFLQPDGRYSQHKFPGMFYDMTEFHKCRSLTSDALTSDQKIRVKGALATAQAIAAAMDDVRSPQFKSKPVHDRRIIVSNTLSNLLRIESIDAEGAVNILIRSLHNELSDNASLINWLEQYRANMAEVASVVNKPVSGPPDMSAELNALGMTEQELMERAAYIANTNGYTTQDLPPTIQPFKHAEQAMPIPNGHTPIQILVMQDMLARTKLGVERYGTMLQPHNGRDFLKDTYEELLDLCMYFRGFIEERDQCVLNTVDGR